jgi:hypothetical protein
MEQFSYVMVLASVVIGLGLTHLLQGVARIVQHPQRFRPYWPHLVWVAYVFEYTMLWWWYEFALAQRSSWTFGIYSFVLIYAIVIAILCALLFPLDLRGYRGFGDYLISRRRWFFGLNIAVILLDVVDTLLKGTAHFCELGWHYPTAAVLFGLLYAVAIFVPNRRYIAFLAVISLADHTWQSFENFAVLP